MTLPNTLEEITAEWLTAALSSNYPGVQVKSVFHGTQIAGTGMKVRLLLDYNAAGHAARLPATMWIKGALHEYAKNIRAAFQREVLFYRDVAPLNIVRSPRAYFAQSDAEAGQGIVLMEDLLASNASFGDPVQPASVDLVAQTLKMEARLHARWWRSPELSKFGERGGSLRTDGVIDRLMAPASWNAAMSMPRSRGIPAPLRDGARVHAAIHKVLAANDRLPECLLHGDPHLGNMYFTADGAIGFLDWQRMMRGPWIWDAAYTLCGFLSIEDRRAHERELLASYLDELQRAGGEPPSFEEAWQLYLAQLFYGMVWSVVPPGTQPEDAIESVCTRFAVAIADHDAFKAVQ
mgnify:FL=1|nr:aminoglycoside phosphotransferase family protein [uncultured Steroidobacter sp.]